MIKITQENWRAFQWHSNSNKGKVKRKKENLERVGIVYN